MLLLIVLFILFVGNYIYPYSKKRRTEVGILGTYQPTNPLLYSFFSFRGIFIVPYSMIYRVGNI